jgi:LacI family transcriptional regulator
MDGCSDDSSRTVGILYLVDYRWAFAWILIQPIVVEIMKNLEAEGYSVVLIPVRTSDNVETVLDRVTSSGVVAVLPIHYGNQILFIRLEDIGIPVVVVMNSDFQTKYYSVCVDDFQGAYEGCTYLLGLGHRNIAFIDGERKDLPLLSRDRFFGFQKAMAEAGITLSDEYHITVDFSDAQTIADALEVLMNLPEPPSALFALDDDLALRLYDALRHRGISIPKDISIIAPGDVLDYELPHTPPITTMRINTTLMGRITAELLLNRLKRRQEDIHVLKVNQKLVDRGSCRTIGPAVTSDAGRSQ